MGFYTIGFEPGARRRHRSSIFSDCSSVYSVDTMKVDDINPLDYLPEPEPFIYNDEHPFSETVVNFEASGFQVDKLPLTKFPEKGVKSTELGSEPFQFHAAPSKTKPKYIVSRRSGTRNCTAATATRTITSRELSCQPTIIKSSTSRVATEQALYAQATTPRTTDVQQRKTQSKEYNTRPKTQDSGAICHTARSHISTSSSPSSAHLSPPASTLHDPNFIPDPIHTFLHHPSSSPSSYPLMCCAICQQTSLKFRASSTWIQGDSVPLLLPCGHIAGKRCLSQWLRCSSASRASPEKKPTCPFCRLVLTHPVCGHTIAPFTLDLEHIHSVPPTLARGGRIAGECKVCALERVKNRFESRLKEVAVEYRSPNSIKKLVEKYGLSTKARKVLEAERREVETFERQKRRMLNELLGSWC